MSPRAVLEQGLSRRLGRRVRVTACRAEAMDSFSSHPIQRLRLVLDDGSRLSVVFKELRPHPAREVRREVAVYERLLDGGRFGAPLRYASTGAAAGPSWLFLEDLDGRRLDRCGWRRWPQASHWLGRLHSAGRARAALLPTLGCLVEHDGGFYAGLAAAARERLRVEGQTGALARLDALAGAIDGAANVLAAQPRTLLHGDASAHNLMICDGRLRAVDWEWAAVGPAAWDVDKLLAGCGARKAELLAAYEGALGVTLDRRALAAAGAMRALWYLGWWVQPCATDPGFVAGLLDKVARAADA